MSKTLLSYETPGAATPFHGVLGRPVVPSSCHNGATAGEGGSVPKAPAEAIVSVVACYDSGAHRVCCVVGALLQITIAAAEPFLGG